MSPEQTIRLECLKLAAQQTSGPQDTCQRAQVFVDFVQGAERPNGSAPAPTTKPQERGRVGRA